MIGRGYLRAKAADDVQAGGFDAFELRLGDLMRGERATMGKSLLDVQRELKIKAAYIAAIENSDPTAFDTPGFIAGYVRSYARYLNMDADWAFETFCQESGFATAHGMSPASSVLRSSTHPGREEKAPASGLGKEIFSATNTPFLPASPGLLANVEPRAVGSVLVLAGLLVGLGWGGWMVLREVQKVTFAPVEQPPTVVAEVDPLAGGAGDAGEPEGASLLAASPEALDRLYRPDALEVPVLVPRDGPIAALDPASVGVVTPAAPPAPGDGRPGPAAVASAAPVGAPAPAGGPLGAPISDVEATLASVLGAAPAPAAAEADPAADPDAVRVTAGPAPAVQLVAVRESWVRVRAPDGTTLFEGILGPGDTFDVPQGAEPALLRTGESGALYMALNGVPYGPVGEAGQVSSNVPLSAEAIGQAYQVADLAGDEDLAEYVAVAQAGAVSPADLPPGQVLPLADPAAAQAPAAGTAPLPN
jgi:hypothetical protein